MYSSNSPKSNLLHQINKEKEKALSLQKETEQQKRETEELNKLIKSLNEDLNLKVIIEKIGRYVENKFEIEHVGLYHVNQEKTHITPKELFFPEFMSEEERAFMSGMNIPIQNVAGTYNAIFKDAKPLYIKKIKARKFFGEEGILLEILGMKSLLSLPLILNNEPIGILNFANFSKFMNLSKEDIVRFSIMAEQLAGVIHGSNLLGQIQEEKEKALESQKQAIQAKEEIAQINQFLKKIQEKTNILDVTEEIGKYIQTMHNINYYFLWLYNPVDDSFHYVQGTYPNQEQMNAFLKHGILTIPRYEKGIHASASFRKTPTFLPNMRDRIPAPSEAKNQQILNMVSLIVVPLYVQDTLIGLLDFTHGQEKIKISKADLEKIYIFCQQIAGVIQNFSLLEEVRQEKEKSERLLLNILPKEIAEELKRKGFAEPTLFESVSVMFTDFKGFTKIAENLTPQELIRDLDACFGQFDKITERYNLEKLKTIGDSYMCASGVPRPSETHAIDCVLAALEIQSFMNMMKEIKESQGFPYWELRLGIHSGPLVAGVIGEKKFAYDVWGDTVNTASRMESSGTPGKINISGTTYELVKEFFECEYRGKVNAKNKGEVDMYYVNRLKSEFSKDEEGKVPNKKFWELYYHIQPK